MAQQLTIVGSRLPKPINANISQEQWRVLTDAIFPTAKTPEAVMLALEYCRARNLDPFKRPVHVVPMWSSTLKRQIETVWPGINELQVTASRSGAWAGMDEPHWGPMQEYVLTGGGGEDDNGRLIPAKTITIKAPESCTVTVYRNVGGNREAFAEPVYWLEAYARAGRGTELPNDMWSKRPRGQLHKCAKAASLRAAFPEDLGSTFAAEEMEGKEVDGDGQVLDMKADAQHTASGAPDFQQEEESEFVIRADSRLGAAGAESASAWLKAFLAIMAECPTLEDMTTIAGWEGVKNAAKAAPKLIQAQISDAIKTAEKRLTESAALAAVDTPTIDPVTTEANTLIAAMKERDTDANVLAWRMDRDTKTRMAALQAASPAEFDRVEREMAAWRAGLNEKAV